MKDKVRAKARAKFKEYVWMYLSTHACIDCGEKDPVVLEFDHVRGEKRCIVSRAITHGTWTVLLEEIAKCDVRCANCHRRKTAKDQGWNKAIGNS